MARRGRPPLNSLPIETDLPELLSILNRALSSPYGIRIPSTKPNRLLQKLYAARRECGHQNYHSLVLREETNAVLIVPREQ